MKKITKATVKKFIRVNRSNLEINVETAFDGMVDGCEDVDGGFEPIKETERSQEHTMGIAGAWFVGSGRDYFTAWESETHEGIEVYNCCGNFILAVKK